MTALQSPPSFTLEWCRRLGASPETLIPLSGGINNRVFQCVAREQAFVLKGYAAHQDGQHDRFAAEVRFLRYAELTAPKFVPKLIEVDTKSRSIVLECLQGHQFAEGSQLNPEDIASAAEFFKALNADRGTALQLVLSSAAEGFGRVTDHLENISVRISQMSTQHLPLQLRTEGEEVVKTLWTALDKLRAQTERLIATAAIENELDPMLVCVSPSDFGFHNAIRTSSGTKFFDFEFAGWDDPTKAIADFELQPRVPIGQTGKILSQALPQWDQQLEARFTAIRPILQLKWACIVLGVLNSDRLERLKEHGGTPPEDVLQAKITLAKKYLSEE